MTEDISQIKNSFPKRSIYQVVKNGVARLVYGRVHFYKNREGYSDYDFKLISKKRPPGTSVMLRAKNEEDMIEMSIRSIHPLFDEIVFIDNGSEDATLEIVERLKKDIDTEDKIRILQYPFEVARCGAEHASTAEDSVSSLVYYYNWCLSHLTRNYVVKWDADMCLKPGATRFFKKYLEQIQKYELRLELPIQTIYLDENNIAYEALDEINIDNQIFPNRSYIRYRKGEHWESLHMDFYIPQCFYPRVDFYEIKDTKRDEFSHWTTTEFTTPRKIREWENYMKVRSGEIGSGFKNIGHFKEYLN